MFIPRQSAMLCLDCEGIGDNRNQCACGSRALMQILTVIPTLYPNQDQPQTYDEFLLSSMGIAREA